MAAALDRWDGEPPSLAELTGRLRAEGLEPHSWSNPPGDEYGWHEHGYTKVLYCVSGGITFRTDEGSFPLSPGDRLVIDPHTRHAATVGPAGVQCVEAPHERHERG